MFFEKTIKIINDLGKNHKIAVFTTMGCEYRDPHGNATIISLNHKDFKLLIGTVAKSGGYKIFVIDNLFNIFDSYFELKRAVEFLREIAMEYKITIIT